MVSKVARTCQHTVFQSVFAKIHLLVLIVLYVWLLADAGEVL